MEHVQPSVCKQQVIPPLLLKDVNTTLYKPNLQAGGTLLQQPYTSVAEESRKAYRHFLHTKRLTEEEDHGYIFLFSYYPVRPVIQNGPVCGLVALAMASELARGNSVTTEEILSEARKKGFSKQGEMFSASALQELAAHFLPCKVSSLHLKHSDTVVHCPGRDLAEQLMLRNLILIPYDADKNHAPCQKQGHKAHWALLTGFFAAVKAEDAQAEILSHCKRDPGVPKLYYWPDDPEPSLCGHLAQLVLDKAGDLFVLGHQGKSKYAGMWHLNDLLLSNDNLLEAGPERSHDDYVIPLGGVEAGLRAQVITVHIQSDR